MRPVKIVGETPRACSGHTLSLSTRVVAIGGRVLSASAWRPSPAELRMLRNGGSVVVSIAGFQVPLVLSVEPAAFERG